MSKLVFEEKYDPRGRCTSTVDTKLLLKKQMMTLMVRSRLYSVSTVDGTKRQIPLHQLLIAKLKLKVNMTTATDLRTDKIFNRLELKDDGETAVHYLVPTTTRKVTAKMSGEIKLVHSLNAGDAGKQFVSISKSFTINKSDESNLFGAFHLIQCRSRQCHRFVR